MMTEMVLPELGENIESGTIVKILVGIGEPVRVDQPVVELETDKAVVEVPSAVSGIVDAVFVAEGEEIRIGQKIISVDTDSKSAKPEEITKHQESVEEKRSDDTISSGQPDLVLKSEQPPVSLPKQNDTGTEKAEKSELLSPLETVAPAAPSVRRFAREIGLDINDVSGTGPGGRISVEDVKHLSRSRQTQSKISEGMTNGAGAEPLPDFTKWGEIERVPMSMIRRKTASHLGYAWSTIPQVTQFDHADITDLERFRKEHAGRSEAAGGKLTMTAILLKVLAGAMKVFPRFNASIDIQSHEIIYKKYCHIGVAVDTKRGLLVPVVRDVDKMNLVDISVTLTQLAEKARNKKLSLADMTGGNFTVSNLGGIGGTAFTPIVNPPEVAILGVSRSQLQPRYRRHGRPYSRLMLPLSLSYDHRIIDGADGARFLRWICQAIEQPLLLALEG